MNQILSVEPSKRKGPSKKASIHSIVLVFAIFLLIFGIGLTSTGAYSYYKNVASNNDKKTVSSNGTKPKITIERESSNAIKIVATHDKEISNIKYKLNDEEEVEVEGNGENELQKELELKTGSNKISIIATDTLGTTSSYETTFEVEQKPIIILEQANGKIQITTESTINIDYILYYWDDQEQSAEPYKVNDLKNVTQVEVLEGTHTLNVKAVDIEGHETTKTIKVKGVSKPTIDVTTDGKKFFINAKDAEGITKIEIKLNSGEVRTKQVNATEFNTEVEMTSGVNKLTVVVYNKGNLSETSKVKYTKE